MDSHLSGWACVSARVPEWGGGCRFKECTGKSIENLEREKAMKAALESQNKAQTNMNCELQEEVCKRPYLSCHPQLPRMAVHKPCGVQPNIYAPTGLLQSLFCTSGLKRSSKLLDENFGTTAGSAALQAGKRNGLWGAPGRQDGSDAGAHRSY